VDDVTNAEQASSDPVIPAVMRPGFVVPALGYTGAFGFLVAALVVPVFSAPRGFHPPLTGAADLWGRLMTGAFFAAASLFLYMLGSSRIVLETDKLHMVTGGLEWSVGRAEITEVFVSSGLTVVLADECRIRPLMLNGGVVPFLDRRVEVAKRIDAWKREPAPVAPSGYRWWRWPCRRHWHILARSWFLLGLAIFAAVIDLLLRV